MLLSSFSKRQKIPFSSCEYASKMSRRSYCLQKFMTLTFHCGKKVNIGKKCDTLRQKKPYIFLNTVRRVVFFFFYKIVQRHEFYSGIITTRICFIFRNVFFFGSCWFGSRMKILPKRHGQYPSLKILVLKS